MPLLCLLEAELMEMQAAKSEAFTLPAHAAQSCGSGGTTAGLALGNALNGMGATIHAYGVCDDEEYFYNFIDGIYKDLGATPDRLGQTCLFIISNPWNKRHRACVVIICPNVHHLGTATSAMASVERLV